MNEVNIPAELSSDGTAHRWNDTDEPNHGIDGGEHTNTFMKIIADVLSMAQWVATQAASMASSVSAAATSEANAAASAAAAAQQANTLTATSTTSLAISTGSKTLTTQSGEQFISGQFVTIADSVTPSNYMYGQVTSYSGTSLVVNVTATGGSGTKASWTISLSGIQGATGADGANTTATNVTNTPAGGISATTVQAALNELDTEKFSRGKVIFLMGR
jgi:hypothetical protein